MIKKTFFLILLMLSISCNRFGKTANVGDAETNDFSEIQSSAKENIDQEELITFPVKITRIVDGDTAEMLYHELTLTVRLAHIDAPESWGNQPYGEAAKDVLAELCAGETMIVSTRGEFDGFGRLIAVLIGEGGTNINKEMVRRGYAWHYKEYSDDASYDRLEQEARAHDRGLWRRKNPVAPWNFR